MNLKVKIINFMKFDPFIKINPENISKVFIYVIYNLLIYYKLTPP